MNKHAAIIAAYLAAGVAVTAWSAQRGAAAKPHWAGIGSNPAVALASSVALWPYAVFHNLTAK